MKVFIELLQLINSGNAFICGEDTRLIKEVKGHENVIILEKEDKIKSETLKLCKGINLIPNSISNFKNDCDWLSFRFSLQPQTDIDKIIDKINKDLSIDNNQCLIGKPIKMQCQCGQNITSFQTFAKVCPLPLMDLNSALEGCFCHFHDVSFENYSKIPQENECFFDELSFYLNQSLFDLPQDCNIKCNSCLKELGHVKNNVVKIWANDVRWVSENKIVFNKTASQTLSKLIHSIEKDIISTNTELVLKLLGNTKECIYISVMDNDLTLLVNENSVRSIFESNVNTVKKMKAEDGSYNLIKHKGVKVLYFHRTNNENIDKRRNAEVINCNYSFFSSILQNLSDTNICLPPDLRLINGLKVGYILHSSSI